MEAIKTASPAERIERIRAAQHGDVEAFAALVQEHEGALRRFCDRLLGDAAPAQDLAQETLLRAFQALPRLEDPARFGAWLFGIAANPARLRRTLADELASTSILSAIPMDEASPRSYWRKASTPPSREAP